jgi:hypothetical protein
MANGRLAAPTRLTYQSKDAGVDAEKADDIARWVTELRGAGARPLPGEALTRTNY